GLGQGRLARVRVADDRERPALARFSQHLDVAGSRQCPRRCPRFRHCHLPEDTGSVDRVWTIPNALSAARLAGVPVFLWLVLGLRSATGDYWAVGLLIAAGGFGLVGGEKAP